MGPCDSVEIIETSCAEKSTEKEVLFRLPLKNSNKSAAEKIARL